VLLSCLHFPVKFSQKNSLRPRKNSNCWPSLELTWWRRCFFSISFNIRYYYLHKNVLFCKTIEKTPVQPFSFPNIFIFPLAKKPEKKPNKN
jgi:hypothetical protein